MWSFIHLLKRFCAEMQWDGNMLMKSWNETTRNGTKPDRFDRGLIQNVCDYFKLKSDQFDRIQSRQVISSWYQDTFGGSGFNAVDDERKVDEYGRHFQVSEHGNLDLTVFENLEMQCLSLPLDLPITERCLSLKRLGVALRYHDVMESSNWERDLMMATFIEFNEEIYKIWLDDVTHLTKDHRNDVQQIHLEWREMYGFPDCDYFSCERAAVSGRNTSGHRGRGYADKNYLFFAEYYDRAHNFVAHFKDIWSDLENDDDRRGRDDYDDDNIRTTRFDEDYHSDSSRKREFSDDSGLRVTRFAVNKEASPFKNDDMYFDVRDDDQKEVDVDSQQNSGKTMFEAVFERLIANDVNDEALERLRLYLEQHEYDSDSIAADSKYKRNSNIFEIMHSLNENQAVTSILSHFVQGIQCMYNVKSFA